MTSRHRTESLFSFSRGAIPLGFAAAALALAGCGGGGSDGSGNSSSDSFHEPPVVASVDGVLETTLEVKNSVHFLGGHFFDSPTYNDGIPGPTLRVKQGDKLRIHLVNNMSKPDPSQVHSQADDGHDTSDATNLHFHGFHVSPADNHDNVLIHIHSGDTFDYEIDIPPDHPGGLYWYHPHEHGNLGYQLSSGMTGAIVIEGELERIPEVAAASEHVLVISEIILDQQDRIAGEHPHDPGLTRLYPVNGIIDPTIHMRPGEVQRWRIANTNGDRFMPIQLDGHTMFQIALDGNTFAETQERDQILLAPANRTEVMIRAGDPGRYELRALPYDRGFGGLAPEIVLATLVVSGEPTTGVIPTTLVPPPSGPEASQVVAHRDFEFDIFFNGPEVTFGINGQSFDINRVDTFVKLDTTEEWTIRDKVGEEHPFHIHTNPFQVIAVNGQPVETPIWQDTMIVPKNGSITIRMTFRDFTGDAVYHCHIAEHSDLGMMGIFEVDE